MSFVWSSLLYCLLSVFPSLHSKRAHVILLLESDWIMLKIIVYKAKYKLLYNMLHYFHCSFDGWHLVPLWLEMEKAMMPLCYFSISLSPILTVSLSVCLLENRKTLSFFHILNCERLRPCSECTSATGEPSSGYNWNGMVEMFLSLPLSCCPFYPASPWVCGTCAGVQACFCPFIFTSVRLQGDTLGHSHILTGRPGRAHFVW